MRIVVKKSLPKNWLKKMNLHYASMQVLIEFSITFCQESLEELNKDKEVLLNLLQNKVRLINSESTIKKRETSRIDIKKLIEKFSFWDNTDLTEIYEVSKKYLLEVSKANSKISKIKLNFPAYHHRFDNSSQSLLKNDKLKEDLHAIISVYTEILPFVTELKERCEKIT